MRVEKREFWETLDYPTLIVDIGRRDGRVSRLLGVLKSERTGLVTDTVLFKDEGRLGELIDDLSEVLDEVKKTKGNDGTE